MRTWFLSGATVFLGLIAYLAGFDQVVQGLMNSVKANRLAQKNYANAPQWPDDARLIKVGAEYSSEHLLFDVSINGVDGFKFLFSTEHSQFSLVDTEKVRSLNLHSDFTTKSQEVFQGNIKEKGVSREVDISIGGLEFPRQTVTILEGMDYWGLLHEKEKRFDGIIGMPLLHHAAISVNPDKNEVYLSKQVDDFAALGYESVAFERLDMRAGNYGDAIYVPVVVKQRNVRDYPTLFMWSAMSNYVPCILNDANNMRVQPPPTSIQQSPVLGHSRKIGRIKGLGVGVFNFDAPVCSYMDNPINSATNGIVGSEIINRFHVIYDLKNTHLYLKPARTIGRPFGFDQTGFTANRMSDGRFIIHSVEAGTPAARVGLKPGAIITHINGWPAHEVTDASYKNITQSDTEVVLMADNGVAYRLVLTPRI